MIKSLKPFLYTEMSTDSSVKHDKVKQTKKNRQKLQKNAPGRYQDLSEEEKNKKRQHGHE